MDDGQQRKFSGDIRKLSLPFLIIPLFQSVSVNLMTAFPLSKIPCRHYPSLILCASPMFKTWRWLEASAICYQKNGTTSNKQSSVSQKRYSSHFHGMHVP